MAVYTELTIPELNVILQNFNLGKAIYLNGIREGIENSNYYLTTEKVDIISNTNNFVLTVFERTQFENLIFFQHWLKFLYEQNLPVPLPILNQQNCSVFKAAEKPAMILTKLIGVKVLSPNANHCWQIGAVLGKTHQVCKNWFSPIPIPANPRNINWWENSTNELEPLVSPSDKSLIEKVKNIVFEAWQSPAVQNLPYGAVHCDLFRDNVLFEEQQNRISGIFDFFFGGEDYFLYDLAVTINDWCSYRSDELVEESYTNLLKAYQEFCPLTTNEKKLLPLMLLAASFRFYLSRLHDVHFPRAGMVDAHDPARFRELTENRLSVYFNNI